jgi:hypothetical protein
MKTNFIYRHVPLSSGIGAHKRVFQFNDFPSAFTQVTDIFLIKLHELSQRGKLVAAV